MSLYTGVKSFLLEKFWTPVVDESVFYNPFNTALYSGLFAVAAAYIGYPVLKKLDVKLDRDFFKGIAPFIFLGGSVRSLKDIDAFQTILLETPFIYLVMFGLVVGSIALSKEISDKTDYGYSRILSVIGSVLLVLSLSFFSVQKVSGFAMILSALGVTAIILYSLLKLFRPDLLSYEFFIPVFSHYMDAAVTGVALLFPGTYEKHVLARFFIDQLGSIPGMYTMKTLVIVPAVIYIIRNVEGEEKLYYLFLITVLGVAISTRNLLSFISIS